MVVSTPLRPQDNGRRLISPAVGKSLLQAFYDAFCELVRKFLHKAIEQASAIEHAGLARQRDQLDFDVHSVVGFLDAPRVRKQSRVVAMRLHITWVQFQGTPERRPGTWPIPIHPNLDRPERRMR